MNYKIRLANTSDCRLLFDWVNDPDVRKASFKSENIKWEDHEKWFIEKIKNPNTYIFIFEVEDKQVGQIRFDMEEDKSYLIDFSIQKEFRGLSYSSMIIENGINFMMNLVSKPIIFIGIVKSENLGSIKAFQKNSFKIILKNTNILTFQKSL
jgi:RimJ/RimL family protein N-acetyltransferase